MANDSGKIELAPDVLEPTPEPESSGSLSGDGSGGPPSPRITRFGAGGEGGGGRRERGVVARESFFARLGKFFRDTRSEMKRVSWPSMKEVQNTTLITLVAVIFFAVYLFAVDHVWAFLLTQLDHLLNKVTGAA
ncbi:MAG: SecE/Sec61-gamma subunit of protein translocation complex [Blastocatellia bacterium]|nr:SecE/Sec61-gamma subunit of protein translocation complex [Blastocatellia bacterium]